MLLFGKYCTKIHELLKREAEDYSPGYGVTLQMAKNADARLIDAQQKGASFLIGGPSFNGVSSALKPTIVTGVKENMIIYDEESFGPSVSLYIVKDDREAIELVNASSYGLNAAVHAQNMTRGIDISRALEVGQVHINNITEHDERMSGNFILYYALLAIFVQ